MAKASRVLTLTCASWLVFGACSSDSAGDLAGPESTSDSTDEVALASDSPEPTDLAAALDTDGGDDNGLVIIDSANSNATDELPAIDDSGSGTTVASTGPNDPDPDGNGSTAAPNLETCEAPAGEVHFVDVPTDDLFGNVAVRRKPDPDDVFIATRSRGRKLIPSGNCVVVGGVNWWEVSVPPGDSIGWTSSEFLVDQPVATPGLGGPSTYTDFDGLGAGTIDQLLDIIADALAFDGDRTITEIEFVEAREIDELTEVRSWRITGARVDGGSDFENDLTDGVRVDIPLKYDMNHDTGEIIGVQALEVQVFPLCSSGVNDESDCI